MAGVIGIMERKSECGSKSKDLDRRRGETGKRIEKSESTGLRGASL